MRLFFLLYSINITINSEDDWDLTINGDMPSYLMGKRHGKHAFLEIAILSRSWRGPSENIRIPPELLFQSDGWWETIRFGYTPFLDKPLWIPMETDDPTAKPPGSTYTVCCCKQSVPHKTHAFPASSRTRMAVRGGSFDVAERAWPIIEHRSTGFKSLNIVESCQSFVSIYLPVYLSIFLSIDPIPSSVLYPIAYIRYPILSVRHAGLEYCGILLYRNCTLFW